MSDVSFEVLGRDVQAAADAEDSAFANAVKNLVKWFAGEGFEDALWSVTGSSSDKGASVVFKLVKKDAYVVPAFPGGPELSEEQVASQVRAAAASDVPGAEVLSA